MNPLRQTLLLAHWQFRRQSQFLPMLVIVQVILAAATIIGYGLLIGDLSGEAPLYLATGAPTVTLIIGGFVMTPQFLLTAKAEGSLDWMRTLPIPRSMYLLSDLLVWTLVGLPGMTLGVVAAALRFDVSLSLTPWIPVIVILISLTAASIGYAIASLLPPVSAQALTQLLVFVVLLFSPVSFPSDRLPDWLTTVHGFLPIRPMADLMRASLAGDRFGMSAGSLGVLVIWCVACIAAALLTLRRRT